MLREDGGKDGNSISSTSSEEQFKLLLYVHKAFPTMLRYHHYVFLPKSQANCRICIHVNRYDATSNYVTTEASLSQYPSILLVLQKLAFIKE